MGSGLDSGPFPDLSMNLKVEIDRRSGFCGGVIRAIGSAEKYLADNPGHSLCSLGAIVHNEEEMARLSAKGLNTVSSLDEAGEGPVLIRAHGEPPATYRKAEALGLELIDCTCPVVLRLQEKIRDAYKKVSARGGKIIIFGRIGHAEVLGLVGQTEGEAIVVETPDMILKALESGLIDTDAPVEVFSQTTGSPEVYSQICETLSSRIGRKDLIAIHNTICSQVAFRHQELSNFARIHDVIVFVSGKHSSNGNVLYNLCRNVNSRSYRVSSQDEIDPSWFRDGDSVGVCGATSTPKWLLEKIAAALGGIKTVC